MTRLPQPGSDNGHWGTILNDFLSQAHKSDGTLRDHSVTANILADDAVTLTKLSSSVRASLNNSDDTGSRLNVRNYGAVGNGTTDDSAAIKAAQADMVDGSVMYFPAGTYRFAAIPTDPLDRGAVVLAGLDNVGVYFEPGAVLLMDNLDGDGMATCDGILVSGKAKHISIVNATVKWKTRPSARGGHANGIHVMGYPSDGTPAAGWLGSTGLVQHVKVTNCTVYQSGEAGMIFVGASDVTVVGTTSLDTLADGLHFTGCRRVSVNGHHSINVEDDGLAFVNYYHPTQKWEDPYIGPFWFPGLSEWCSSGTASSIVVAGNRANGFRVQMGKNITINGISIQDKGAVGNLTSAKLNVGNPWQSIASENVTIKGVTASDCDGGLTIETYNIDGDDDPKWWRHKNILIDGVSVENIGNWSMSTEQKDTDKSAVAGITIKNFKAVAGDNSPGENYGGHGGIRLVGLVDSVVDGLELVSDHDTAQIIFSSASQLRTEHLWTDPTTHVVENRNVGVTPENLPNSNLVIDNVITHGCDFTLFQDIAGLTIGRVDAYEAPGVGISLFKVANAKIQHLGAVNPARTHALGRGVQVDNCVNIDIQEIICTTDDHVSSDVWQCLEIGGGDAVYPAGKGIRIEKVIYTSTRNDTVSDIVVQSGTYAPTEYYIQGYWRHSGETIPKWRSQLFGDTNPAYLDEYRSHPLYVNTDSAHFGEGTGEIAPWETVVGEIDFDTLTTQGRYYITGSNPGYLYDGTTSKHQPPGAPGNILLEVITKHRDDTGDTIVQTYVPLGDSNEVGGYRYKASDTESWGNWKKFNKLFDGQIYRELLNGNVIGTIEGTRSGNITSSSTPTFTTDGWDVLVAVNWAHNVTDFSTNASGSPTSGMRLRFRIQDNGTPCTWNWGNKFISGPAMLLTTTVAGKRHYVEFEYDDSPGKWVCVLCDVSGF